MKTKAAIVLTTIFDPVVLENYFENMKKFGNLEDVQVFLVPDRKTPPSAYRRCDELRRRGLRVACPSFDEQEAFLRRVGLPPETIPYNSDNRRNVGYLMSLDTDADFVISVDDDNHYRPEEDFVSEHQAVCKGPVLTKVVTSETGWFNVCDSLAFDRPGPVYPRGFPYYARHRQANVKVRDEVVEVHINAGLWLSDPDMDGISWLVNPVQAMEFLGNSFILDTSAWSPVNTQNTGLRREVVASYYFVRMGYSLGGLTIDRYGDIFSGYFAQACTKHLGGTVRIGTPIAKHLRNSHDYIKDASKEWACIVVLEDLLPWLTREIKLSGNNYCDVYESLSHELESAVEKFRGQCWTDAARSYFHDVAKCMRNWAEVCRSLGVQTSHVARKPVGHAGG